MKKIAIVDDSEHFIDAFEYILNVFLNIELIVKTNDGNILLNYPEIQNIEIAFVDINMKIIDGVSLTSKLKKLFPHIKIIAISTYVDDFVRHELIGVGANLVIDKNDLDVISIKNLILSN